MSLSAPANKYRRAPAGTVGFFSSGGNSVHLLFPLHKQDRYKSWARGGKVQPILEHQLSVPVGANGLRRGGAGKS